MAAVRVTAIDSLRIAPPLSGQTARPGPIVGHGTTKSLWSGYGPHLIEFRILGPLEVVGENGLIRLGGPKQRAVLAILLLNANRVVPVERLADDLYGDAIPASALTQIQAHISQLRRLLDPQLQAGAPGSLVETRAPGYVIRLAREQLDLRRFERWTAEASEASAGGDPAVAARRLSDALDLWRGPALADLARESFAKPEIARLEDLRLCAVEDRMDAELSLSRHSELVGELETLVSDYPLRERFTRQLMVALYRSGRQAEALAVYRRARRALVDEFALEPTPALQQLERAILTQDPSLESPRSGALRAEQVRSVLVVYSEEAQLGLLLSIAEPLAAAPGRELILARPVGAESQLVAEAAALAARRRELRAPARAAAFVTTEWVRDVSRFAESADAELVLVDAPSGLDADRVPHELAGLFERLPADVAVLVGCGGELESKGGIFVPFGGGEHDWAALELAAHLAASVGATLRLVGTRARPRRGQRDASMLLADASIAVQRLVDVDSEPLLADPTEDALVEAVAGASLVAVGISSRWRRDGIGATRRALLRTGAPLLLVHRGPRPGVLAPRDSRTRFTWSVES